MNITEDKFKEIEYRGEGIKNFIEEMINYLISQDFEFKKFKEVYKEINNIK